MAILLNVSSNEWPNQNSHLLNKWCGIMMEDVFHFNQAAGIGAPMQTANDKSNSVYLQKEREYIGRNLESAAIRMSADLNYWLSPMYFNEVIPIGSGAPFQHQRFQGRWCKMTALGKRGQTLIQAGVAVTYTDPNNSGVNDTATITLNTAIADSEIALYFQVADGAPTAGDYRYEIEPIQVTDNGAGVVTIKAHRALFVSPKQWAREYVANDPNFNSPNIVDTAGVGGFVTAVDVYRVYVDTTANIDLLATDGTTVLQSYTGEILDPELSTFRLGDLCASWCGGWPKFVRVNYKAGSPLVNGNIDSELYEACVAFACANMMSRLTHMANWSLDLFNKYHAPMVETVGGQNIPVATSMQAKSIYGARYGQVLASDVVQDRRIFKGHKLTYNMRH